MTNEERAEALALLIEYTQTKILLVGQREKDLIRRYLEEHETRKQGSSGIHP